jgi:hypothetical protein
MPDFARTTSMKIDRAARCVLLSITVFVINPVSAAELRCPPRLPGAHAGFERVGPVPTAHWLLHDMRLFDGLEGEELKTAPAELAPDSSHENRGGFTSIWKFDGTGNLLLVCTYNGSGTYYRALTRQPPTRCISQSENGLTQAWCQ